MSIKNRTLVILLGVIAFNVAAIAATVTQEEAIARLQAPPPGRFERLETPLKDVIVALLDGAPVEVERGPWFEREATMGMEGLGRWEILNALAEVWDFELTWTGEKWLVARPFKTIDYPLAHAEGGAADSIANAARELLSRSMDDWTSSPKPMTRAEYLPAERVIRVAASTRGHGWVGEYIRFADVARRRVALEVVVLQGHGLPLLPDGVSIEEARKMVASAKAASLGGNIVVREGRAIIRSGDWANVRLLPVIEAGPGIEPEHFALFGQYMDRGTKDSFYYIAMDMRIFLPNAGKDNVWPSFGLGIQSRVSAGQAWVQANYDFEVGSTIVLVLPSLL